MQNRTRVVSPAVTVAALALPGPAAAGTAKSTTFKAQRPAEALLDLRALAPGADWGRVGHESAVVRLELDGRYNQDVVLFNGERVFDYRIEVTSLNRGFFLGADFTPGASFISWQGSAILAPAHPEAVIWP